MIGARELASSVHGAFRLAALHEDGMYFFNHSQKGFWRSFIAYALVAPGYLLLSWIEPSHIPDSGFPIHDALVNILAYVIGCVAFPVAMLPLSRLLERSDRYIGYVIAYNWAAVPQMLLFVTAAVLAQGLSLGPQIHQTVELGASLAVLLYYWFIARTALDIGVFAAIGVVVLDSLIAYFISSIALILTTPPPVLPAP